jgi:hypothetical protein
LYSGLLVFKIVVFKILAKVPDKFIEISTKENALRLN